MAELSVVVAVAHRTPCDIHFVRRTNSLVLPPALAATQSEGNALDCARDFAKGARTFAV